MIRKQLVILAGLAVLTLPLSHALAGGEHGASDHHGQPMHDGTPDHHASEDTVAIATDASPDATFTLRTVLHEGGMAFVGVDGDIDGTMNPRLHAHEGDVVEIELVNGDGVEHDVALEAFGIMADHVATVGERSTVRFVAGEAGEYEYACAIAGHREAGMLGTLEVAHRH